MPDIISLGEPMVEFAAEQRGRLGTVTRFRRGWGGDTSNFIVAAARLGNDCGYITRLGGDEFGRSFLELWLAEGVDASRVIVDRDGFTAVYFIAYRDDGGHDFTYYRKGSAASRLHPDDLDPAYLGRARVFHTSGISQAISESSQATVEAAIEMARAGGALISYDVNLRPRLWPPEAARAIIEATMAVADLVFVSTEDATHLYGDEPEATVVERVLLSGPRLVVLKQGERGCLITSATGERAHVPAWQVDVLDATGAGDAFAAAFLTEWLRGGSLERAGRFANAVGALTARGLGAVYPLPTRTQVEEFISGAE